MMLEITQTKINVDNRQFIDNFNYGAQKLNWKKKKKMRKIKQIDPVGWI